MIIDLSEWLQAERKPPTQEAAEHVPTHGPERPKAELTQEKFSACPHRHFRIDDRQRTVKCGDCDAWLDPVWCLRELFRYYEQRVDFRLARIKAFEDKEKEKAERRDKRRREPRRARAETMLQHLERAAFNEYQAKVLAARAASQRAAAGKIEEELSSETAAIARREMER